MASAEHQHTEQRQAYSLRGLSKAYGFDRAYLSELVRSGDLPAVRRGRALKVLRTDFERWFHAEARRRIGTAEAAVERMRAADRRPQT